MALTLCVNGRDYDIQADPATPLLFVLRNELGLKGTKLGCGLEQCGACAVLVDGQVALSCGREVAGFIGQDITTIEGIAARPVGQTVQHAFCDATAAQCGYCTAGMVVAVTALLETNPRPTQTEVKSALSPHLCRCGSHPRILRAVQAAADSL